MFSLFGNRRSFAGSSTGGLAETQEMLDFCAEHSIEPEIELIDIAAINDAWERVLRSDVRYRFVIDAASLQPAASRYANCTAGQCARSAVIRNMPSATLDSWPGSLWTRSEPSRKLDRGRSAWSTLA